MKSQCSLNLVLLDAAIAWRSLKKRVDCTLPRVVHATSQAKSNCNPHEPAETHPLYYQQLVRPPSLQWWNFSARPATYPRSHCLPFLGYPVLSCLQQTTFGCTSHLTWWFEQKPFFEQTMQWWVVGMVGATGRMEFAIQITCFEPRLTMGQINSEQRARCCYILYTVSVPELNTPAYICLCIKILHQWIKK